MHHRQIPRSLSLVGIFLLGLQSSPSIAQTTTPSTQDLNLPQDRLQLPPQPLPEQPPSLDVAPSTAPPIPEIQGNNPITVKQFTFQGNTAIATEELQAITAPYLGEKTFADLQQAKEAVTQLYVSKGYVTSGAYLPASQNKNLDSSGATIVLQVIEGTLESLTVKGSDRLEGYIRSRLKKATSGVLNQDRLLESLRFLQRDPLIKQISAELLPGTEIGESVLAVQVKTRKPFSVELGLDNSRSPAVGSFQREVILTHSNLSGLGDSLGINYRNTVGSNAISADYTLPINADNGTISASYTYVNSEVIEEPFSQLDILGAAQNLTFTLRQPLLRRANNESSQEFALGLIATRGESENSLLGIPFAISAGADELGRTRVTAIRFFQDWSSISNQQVFLARSQFSFGLGLGTINPTPPDSRFFSWRGQALWMRRLPRKLRLVARGDLQLADRPLVPMEQFSLGGYQTLRGYRQDAVLSDNGLLASLELKIPIYSGSAGEFEVAPFVDFGANWDNQSRLLPIPGILASVGLSLDYRLNHQLSAHVNWGIPIVSLAGQGGSLQENGLYLSVRWKF